MSYGTVYFALCRTSGKGYIGQTTQDIHARWKAHKYGACRVLCAAIRKYGADDFDLVVVAEAAGRVELDRLEKYWIKKARVLVPNGYNLKEGGANGKPSVQTRRRMSEAHRGTPLSEAHRASMVIAQQVRRADEAVNGGGPVFSSASREAMRNAKLGTTHSDETRAKMRLSRIGQTPSEETRERLRLAATGRRHTDETLRKMSDAQQGKKHSEATKRKMSEARRGKKRPPEVMEKTVAKNRGQKRTPEQRERMRQARLKYLSGVSL